MFGPPYLAVAKVESNIESQASLPDGKKAHRFQQPVTPVESLVGSIENGSEVNDPKFRVWSKLVIS